MTLKRIPISAAKQIAERHGFDSVIVIGFAGGEGHSGCSYGTTKANCRETGAVLDDICDALSHGRINYPNLAWSAPNPLPPGDDTMSDVTKGPWFVYRKPSHGRVFHQGRTVCAPITDGTPDDCIAVAYCDYHTPEIAEANAEFIVRACNAHEDLFEALTAAPDFGGEPTTAFGREYRKWQIQARAALSKAQPAKSGEPK